MLDEKMTRKMGKSICMSFRAPLKCMRAKENMTYESFMTREFGNDPVERFLAAMQEAGKSSEKAGIYLFSKYYLGMSDEDICALIGSRDRKMRRIKTEAYVMIATLEGAVVERKDKDLAA